MAIGYLNIQSARQLFTEEICKPYAICSLHLLLVKLTSEFHLIIHLGTHPQVIKKPMKTQTVTTLNSDAVKKI